MGIDYQSAALHYNSYISMNSTSAIDSIVTQPINTTITTITNQSDMLNKNQPPMNPFINKQYNTSASDHTPHTVSLNEADSFRVYIDLAKFTRDKQNTAVLNYKTLINAWEYKIHQQETSRVPGNSSSSSCELRGDQSNEVELDIDNDNDSDDDSADNTSDDDLSQGDMSKQSVNNRKRVYDDYDASDPFIDDSLIDGGASELDVYSGDDIDDNNNDQLHGFVATQHAANIANTQSQKQDKVRQRDERYRAEQQKHLLKQAKKHHYPQPIIQLFDKIKSQAINDNVHKSHSTDSSSAKSRKKQLSNELMILLIDVDKLIQQLMSNQTNRLAYTRLCRFIPDWTPATLKKKIRSESKKQRVQSELSVIQSQLSQLIESLQSAVRTDCARYIELVASAPKKSIECVKVKQCDDGPHNVYTYQCKWNIFTKLIADCVSKQIELTRCSESLKNRDKLDTQQLNQKIDSDKKKLLQEICNCWPKSYDITYKQLNSNYIAYLKKIQSHNTSTDHQSQRNNQESALIIASPHNLITTALNTDAPTLLSNSNSTSALTSASQSTSILPTHPLPSHQITTTQPPMSHTPVSASAPISSTNSAVLLSHTNTNLPPPMIDPLKHDKKRKQSDIDSSSSSLSSSTSSTGMQPSVPIFTKKLKPLSKLDMTII